MAKITNPQGNSLMILLVEFDTAKELRFVFPINPSELTINQASRVSATFTYGKKVIQNLGRGLKTISMTGMTGYRMDMETYGIQRPSTKSVEIPSAAHGITGKYHWLDLYAVIQLIKGENIFLDGLSDQIKKEYSIDNLKKIKSVKLIVPDQAIAYEVVLQNDSFLRNKEQPWVYKYLFNWIVVDELKKGDVTDSTLLKSAREFSGMEEAIPKFEQMKAKLPPSYLLKQKLTSYVNSNKIIGLYSSTADKIDSLLFFANDVVTDVNSKINDARKLERLNNVLKATAGLISNIRLTKQEIESIATGAAFYELRVNLNQIETQAHLFFNDTESDVKETSFRLSLTKISSSDVPVMLSPNKATMSVFDSSVFDLQRSGLCVVPILSVREVIDLKYTQKKFIEINFSESLSSYNVKQIRVYGLSDYEKSNDLVRSRTDNQIVLNGSLREIGDRFNFEVELDYDTLETFVTADYNSIRKVRIEKGDTLDSLMKSYSPQELLEFPSYRAAVAEINNIGYPFVVTTNDTGWEIYDGDFSHIIFNNRITNTAQFKIDYLLNATVENFGTFVFNINSSYVSKAIPLIEYVPNEGAAEREDKDQLKINNEKIAAILTKDTPHPSGFFGSSVKFWTLLVKNMYNNNLYALFGLYIDRTGLTEGDFFGADSYILVGVERGVAYELTSTAILEILNPYNLTADVVEKYNQTTYAGTLDDSNVFEKNKLIIKNLVRDYVLEKAISNVLDPKPEDCFVWTSDLEDRVFLAGNSLNENYPMIINNITIDNATYRFFLLGYRVYRVLMEGEYILLPSISSAFLSFRDLIYKDDVYKIDLNSNFSDLDSVQITPYGSEVDGVWTGKIDFTTISGIPNVKQAIKNRLECPSGGLRLHSEYGLPELLGKKMTPDNLILLKYYMYDQLNAELRIKQVKRINVSTSGDSINSSSSVILVNNDETTLVTSSKIK